MLRTIENFAISGIELHEFPTLVVALETGRGVYDLVCERGLMTRDQLDRLLNPEAMTAPRQLPQRTLEG
jgi:Aspartate ammonia-lyase